MAILLVPDCRDVLVADDETHRRPAGDRRPPRLKALLAKTPLAGMTIPEAVIETPKVEPGGVDREGLKNPLKNR